MSEYIKGVSLHLGSQLVSAQVSSDYTVALQVVKGDGSKEQLECEHIIAATGYKVDVDRIPLLDPDPESWPQCRSVYISESSPCRPVRACRLVSSLLLNEVTMSQNSSLT
jgi:hypothetical protein